MQSKVLKLQLERHRHMDGSGNRKYVCKAKSKVGSQATEEKPIKRAVYG